VSADSGSGSKSYEWRGVSACANHEEHQELNSAKKFLILEQLESCRHEIGIKGEGEVILGQLVLDAGAQRRRGHLNTKTASYTG